MRHRVMVSRKRPGTAAADRARHGFTVVEILLAVLVFVIGLFGVMNMIDTAGNINRRYSERFQALVIAESQMARLRAAGHEALAAERANPTDLPIGLNAPVDEEDDHGFYWRVYLKDAGQLPRALEVTVNVSWGAESPPGVSSAQLSEIIADAVPAGSERP